MTSSIWKDGADLERIVPASIAERALAAHRDDRGQLERPLESGNLRVPESIEIEGDLLVWRLRKSRVVKPGKGVLEDFLQLDASKPEAILRYARRWGVLGLCEHGLPASHQEVMHPSPNCCPLGWDDNGGWEPWSLWEPFVMYARRILEESRWLRRSQGGGSKGAWVRLGSRVTHWLLLGDVRPTVVPTKEGKWHIGLGSSYWMRPWGVGCLPGALAVQLMAAVSCTEGWALCSGCGNAYEPKRRPGASQRGFCEVCRTGKVPQKLAQRDYRERKRCSKANSR